MKAYFVFNLPLSQIESDCIYHLRCKGLINKNYPEPININDALLYIVEISSKELDYISIKYNPTIITDFDYKID